MKNLKILSALLLTAALILSLTACGSKSVAPDQTVIVTDEASAASDQRAETASAADAGHDDSAASAADDTPADETAASETAAAAEETAAPEETPAANARFEALKAEVEAFDPAVELPAEEELLDEAEVSVKYVQGSYGQGILLTYTPHGDKHSTLRDGTALTILAVRGESSFVRAEDGRCGWALSRLLVDKFNERLSFERLRDYIVSDEKYWTASAWTNLILQNADEFPAEVVAAAQAAVNG